MTFPKTLHVRQHLGVQPLTPASVPSGSPATGTISFPIRLQWVVRGHLHLTPKLHGATSSADFVEVTVPESHTLGEQTASPSELTASQCLSRRSAEQGLVLATSSCVTLSWSLPLSGPQAKGL